MVPRFYYIAAQYYAPINGLPQDGGGGATSRKLTFKLSLLPGRGF